MTPTKPPTTRRPTLSSGSQNSQASRTALPRLDQWTRTPKPPAKASYSLFPPPEVPQKQVPAPVRLPSAPRLPGLEPSPLCPIFAPTPKSRTAIADRRGNLMAKYKPGSSRAATPNSVRGGSIAASSSDSIPLLLRSPGPSPPDSPPSTSSSSEPADVDSPAQSPPRIRKCSPSNNNPHNFSLSKITTRSSPSLATLAKAHRQRQAQGPINKSLTPTDRYDRPLPPLPTRRPPSPPHISVFETDSDDEDDGESRKGASSSEAKSFARRLMHGLVHHHHHHQHHYHDRRDKCPGPDHKRSVSDEGPSTSTSKERVSGGGRGGRSGISRTFNAARYRRGGGFGAPGSSTVRVAMSMDLPRDDGRRDQCQEEEREKTVRFWCGRGTGGGDAFLGRILRRRG